MYVVNPAIYCIGLSNRLKNASHSSTKNMYLTGYRRNNYSKTAKEAGGVLLHIKNSTGRPAKLNTLLIRKKCAMQSGYITSDVIK